MSYQAVMDIPFIPAQRTFRDAELYFYGAAFALGNLCLPMAVHGVPNGGVILLPLFFFTLVAAYSEGLQTGLLVAVASPLINHALTGMPSAGMLPLILFKSIFVAAAAAAVSGRLGKISLAAIVGVVVAMQVLGGLFDVMANGDVARAVQALRMGLPGMILMTAGGYAMLRLIANTRAKGDPTR